MNHRDRPFGATLLVVMHILLGIGAAFGGLAFIIDPSGGLLRMPISHLSNSPFSDFFLPGIVLFFVLGVVPLGVSYALARKRQWKPAGA